MSLITFKISFYLECIFKLIAVIVRGVISLVEITALFKQ